jgi:hypothetical protein
MCVPVCTSEGETASLFSLGRYGNPTAEPRGRLWQGKVVGGVPGIPGGGIGTHIDSDY